ncbi:site-specific integrase [Antribacter sp. KLBMP9083]|uniref:Site-specific integrase n=1 Tax=Antribacter soli TaxID=2910976 RepID=A0AA41QG65_9MICO|nr:site-specific integrase [Antribacter soli]MCF4122180.1 site-specific integrase [Antribacter soli]
MSRKPLPVGSHGNINRTPYLGRVQLVGEGKSWYTPGGELVPLRSIRWAARCRFRDNDGRTRPVEAWGATGAEAERRLRDELTARKRAASDTITADTRLEVLADYWLRTKVDPSKRAVNTKQRYRYTTEQYVIPGLGGLLLRECTVSRLEAWVAGEVEKHQATARIALSCLKSMFDVAVREDAITANPATSVTPVPATASKDVQALSVEDVVTLRAALLSDAKARAQDLGDLVDVMLATGCRIGEALALRWVDVDLDKHVVYLTGTVVREERVGLFRQDTTKGKKARGHLIPEFAVTMLERRAAEVPPGELGLVFPSVRAGLREVSTVDRQWRTFRVHHAEWSWITPHTFRKSVGTAVERGADIEAAAAQLGHTRTAITAKHYVATPDLGPDHRAILERFGETPAHLG